MVQIDFSYELNKLESELRAGHRSAVINRIKDITKTSIPRTFQSQFAALARRSGDAYLALHILKPAFRREGRKIISTPTEHEFLIQGSALISIGAAKEGLTNIDQVDVNRFPEANLFRALHQISLWDYKSAYDFLIRYLDSPMLTDQQRLVGNLNFCAACIVLGKVRPFVKTFKETEVLIEKTGSRHLSLVLFELQAQFYYSDGKLTKAQEAIEKAKSTAGNKLSTYFDFLFKKWQLIISANLNAFGSSRNDALKQLEALSEQSISSGLWEIARDCDYQRGRLENNEELLNKVYFGTPLTAYRKRIEQDVRRIASPPKSWIYNQNSTTTSNQIIDIDQAKMGEVQIMPAYQKPWHLFQSLSQDIYRPQQLGAIFDNLFSGQYFDKKSSGHRINQLLFELRQALHNNQINVNFNIKNNFYFFQSKHPLTYRKDSFSLKDRSDLIYQKVLSGSIPRVFTADHIEKIEMISRWTAVSLIGELINKGLVKRIGSGRSQRYKVA